MADEEDDYDDYSDDFLDEDEDTASSPESSPRNKTITSIHKGRVQNVPKAQSLRVPKVRSQGRAGWGRAGGRGRGGHMIQSRRVMSDSHADVVTKRLLSANRNRIMDLQNQIVDMKKQFNEVREENKLFKKVQLKQERALRKLDDSESLLPQMIHSHREEVRSLREQMRHYKEKFEKTDRYLRDCEEELDKSTAQLARYKALSEKKNLGERDVLDRRLKKVETTLEEKNSRISELERHIELVKKNHRHEVGIERARAKDTVRRVEDLREERARLEAAIREKEKQLEAQNIYSNRGNGPPGSHSPPLWRQSLTKFSTSLNDLSFRDKAKAYEEKRRQEAADKREKLHLPKLGPSSQRMEKRANSLEAKPKTATEAVEEEEDRKVQDTPPPPAEPSPKQKPVEREDSEAEFWRRQEALYKQEQTNKEQAEAEQHRKEAEEEAKLKEELAKMRRDLEERERDMQRQRQEVEDRLRREEADRKEREDREKERREAEQQALERREREVREREERENAARLAEEKRKKEELLRRLQQHTNDSSPKDDHHHHHHHHHLPQQHSRAGSQTGSAPHRKDYTFTQTVENLHRGKPAVERQKKRKSSVDSDIGGYQPSFLGPIKTSTAMKQKKPLSIFGDKPKPAENGLDAKHKPFSLFDDGSKTADVKKQPLSLFDDDPKPVASGSGMRLGAGDGAGRKSQLMADLFGSTSSKKDSEDLFPPIDRSVSKPAVPSRRAGGGGFPWDDPSPSPSKPREPEKRGSSALIGGGAAVIEDEAENDTTRLPRRPRKTTTTFNTTPAVRAVENFDDEVEEVVL